MPKRDGTYIDASELTSTAEFLGFTNVQVHHDCNHKEIMEHIKYCMFLISPTFCNVLQLAELAEW